MSHRYSNQPPQPTKQTDSFDEWGNVDASGLHARFRHLPYPPDFQGNPELSALLEAILAEDEDEDKQKGLEEFLEVRGFWVCSVVVDESDRLMSSMHTYLYTTARHR